MAQDLEGLQPKGGVCVAVGGVGLVGEGESLASHGMASACRCFFLGWASTSCKAGLVVTNII